MQDKLRAILVGCGGMAGVWISAARQIPEVDIVAFVDVFEESARKKALDWGNPNAVVETSLEVALQKTGADVVFDCTIPQAHAQVATMALEAGCHVLGEKPLADSMAEARRVVEVAKRTGKTYAVIQNRRYDARIRRVKAFLDAQSIGSLTTLNCDFYIGPHFGGFRDAMRHVLLLDMAIHTFDAARFLSGTDPLAVYCHEWNPPGSWYERDASAIAIFEMTNGVVFTYRGSWCAEGLSTSWNSDWRIVGSKGTARWDGEEHFQAQIPTGEAQFLSDVMDVPLPERAGDGKEDGHLGLMREFVRCARSAETPETVGFDNIKSLAMVFAAIESSESGKRVEIFPE